MFQNTKYKCYIISGSRFSNSSIISLILSFSSLHILVYKALSIFTNKTKKTHHFRNNFFYYLFYQGTPSNNTSNCLSIFCKKIIQIFLTFLDNSRVKILFPVLTSIFLRLRILKNFYRFYLQKKCNVFSSYFEPQIGRKRIVSHFEV